MTRDICVMGVVTSVSRVHIIYTEFFIQTLYSEEADKKMKGVIIMIGGLWLKVPTALFNDERMTRSDIAVFAYAADRLKDNTAELPIKKIAEACEVSERTVMRAIDKLCACGYLKADKRPGKSSLYTQLVLPPTPRKGKAKKDTGEFDVTPYKAFINVFEGAKAE